MGISSQPIRNLVTSSTYEDIQVELTQLIFRKLGGTILVGGVGIVGINLLLAHHYLDPHLLQFSFLIGALCLARFAVVFAFQHRPQATITSAAAFRWEALYGFLTFIYCCSFAAETFYNFRFHDATAQSLSTMGTLALCAALSARMGMRPWICQACGFVMLASLALAVAVSGEVLARFGLIILILFAYTHWEGVQNKFAIVVEQLRSRRTLQHLSEQDALTGLANRRHFEETLAALCTQPRTFGLLYMDLDRFKLVNDTHGHLVGDALLQHVAQRLRKVIRHDDLLARLGGDEFAIIQTHIENDDSPRALAARIHDVLATPILIEGHEIRISASIGARISEGVPTTPRVLLGYADAALYRVKQSGGASFALAEDQPR